MFHYLAPAGSENLIQEHFQVNLKAFFESSDEHLCLSLYDSLHNQPDVLGQIFQRHQEGLGAWESPESQGAGAPLSTGA